MTSANRWALGAAVLFGLCGPWARIEMAQADGTFFKNRPASTTATSSPAVATPAMAAPPEATRPAAAPTASAPTTAAPALAPPPTQPSHASVGTAPPSPTPSSQDVSGLVSQVLSTDTLVVAGQRVQLAGLRGTASMNTAFSRWIASHGNRLSCRALGAGYQCATPEGLDVGRVLIINGAAACTPDAPPAYQRAQLQARQARRGIWAH